jgi:hypothetical protein
MGGSLRDNPFYRSENLPTSESAAVYRAWQMKAEAWERGWTDQDQLMNSAPRRAPQPIISVDRRATPLTARAHETRAHEADMQRKSSSGMAA